MTKTKTEIVAEQKAGKIDKEDNATEEGRNLRLRRVN